MKITTITLILLSAISYGQAEDWPNLKKYAAENAALSAPAGNRIVLMGDSITEFWKTNDPAFFENGIIDRGISGQTSSQMLLRFRQDVISLKPGLVVILAGANDIAGNTGPISDEAILGNIMSMVELAKANHIKVIICSVLPANEFWWKKELKPAERIFGFNKLLKAYAEKQHIVYVDYYSAMADDAKGLPKTYADDGVHPNLNGYKTMEPLLAAGIKKALAKP